MKKLLGLVILSGFVVMIGAAGSTDLANANFGAVDFLGVLLLELLGMAIVLFGTSALMHYKRYVRRMIARKRLVNSKNVSIKKRVADAVRMPEKELC